jgi:hypothetical protein
VLRNSSSSDRCRCEGCGQPLVQWYYRDERILCGDCFRHGVTIRPQEPPPVVHSVGFWSIVVVVTTLVGTTLWQWMRQ